MYNNNVFLAMRLLLVDILKQIGTNKGYRLLSTNHVST